MNYKKIKLSLFFIILICIMVPSYLYSRYIINIESDELIKLNVIPNFYVSFDLGDKKVEDMSGKENYIVDSGNTYKIVSNNKAYGELPLYDNENYKIRGWYDSSSFENEITEDTIVNITDDITLYAKYSTDVASSGNMTMENEWTSDGVIITLNGKIDNSLYIRVAENDFLIGTNAKVLYDKVYSNNPTFKKGDEVFISYTPISGTANLKGAFTIKFRGTSTSCPALNTAELIENHTKKNFDIDKPAYKTGILQENALGYISVYSDAGGSEFDNFTFKISFGKVK